MTGMHGASRAGRALFGSPVPGDARFHDRP